jgi:hypothetical protein
MPTIQAFPEPNSPPPSVIKSPSANELMSGGKAPEPSSAPQFGADGTKLFAQGGEIFSQGFGAKPVTAPAASEPGDNTNVSSNPKGLTSGFPDAGAGPGNGRQPAAAGSTIGQTKARPRTPFNPAYYK